MQLGIRLVIVLVCFENVLVYKLYELTDEEIAIVEGKG